MEMRLNIGIKDSPFNRNKILTTSNNQIEVKSFCEKFNKFERIIEKKKVKKPKRDKSNLVKHISSPNVMEEEKFESRLNKKVSQDGLIKRSCTSKLKSDTKDMSSFLFDSSSKMGSPVKLFKNESKLLQESKSKIALNDILVNLSIESQSNDDSQEEKDSIQLKNHIKKSNTKAKKKSKMNVRKFRNKKGFVIINPSNISKMPINEEKIFYNIINNQYAYLIVGLIYENYLNSRNKKISNINHLVEFKNIEKHFIFSESLVELVNEEKYNHLIKKNIKMNKFVDIMMNKLHLLKKIDFIS